MYPTTSFQLITLALALFLNSVRPLLVDFSLRLGYATIVLRTEEDIDSHKCF